MSGAGWTAVWVVAMVLGAVALWGLRTRLFAWLDQIERDEDERIRLEREAAEE